MNPAIARQSLFDSILGDRKVNRRVVLQAAAILALALWAETAGIVVAAAAAKIPRPAGLAWLLPVDMTRGQPVRLPFHIHAVAERAHAAGLVADEAVVVIDGREVRGKPAAPVNPGPAEPAPVKRGRTRSSPPHRR